MKRFIEIDISKVCTTSLIVMIDDTDPELDGLFEKGRLSVRAMKILQSTMEEAADRSTSSLYWDDEDDSSEYEIQGCKELEPQEAVQYSGWNAVEKRPLMKADAIIEEEEDHRRPAAGQKELFETSHKKLTGADLFDKLYRDNGTEWFGCGGGE